MNQLELSDHAKNDLSDIWFFIALDNPGAARKLIARLLEKMELLAQSPHLGRPREDLRPGLRSVSFANYLIFYRYMPDKVEIVRVLSSYRDISTQFTE